MRGRSSTAAQRAARDVEAAEAKIAEAREAAAAELAGAEQLDSEIRAAVDDQTRFHTLVEQADRARREAQRLEFVAARLEDDLARVRREAADAIYAEERRAAEREYEEAAKASAAAERSLRATIAAMETLAQARARADERAQAAAQLRPDSVDDAPEYVDEPGWGPQEQLDRVAEVITAGPRQPAKSTAAAAAKRATVREQGVREAIASAVADRGRMLHGTREHDQETLRFRFSAIPEERHEEVLDLIEAERAKLRAAYEGRADVRQQRMVDKMAGRR